MQWIIVNSVQKLKKLIENKITNDIQCLEVNICNETASNEELNKF